MPVVFLRLNNAQLGESELRGTKIFSNNSVVLAVIK